MREGNRKGVLSSTREERQRHRHRSGGPHADAQRFDERCRCEFPVARHAEKIRQNLFFAFAYTVLGIPLAALGMLNPVIAGAAMAMSSVSVVCNALLLKRWQRQE